jgi:hypothetical protein
MIGFDGASKEIYEAHRVRCNYERVLSNIQCFAHLRDCSKSNLFNDALAVDWSESATQNKDFCYVHKVPDSRRLDQCVYFDTDLLIQSDGQVGACCWDYNLQISGGGFGNVDETALIAIWHAGKRHALRAAFAERSNNIPEGCKSCIILHDVDSPVTLTKISYEYLESTGTTSFMYMFSRGPTK